MINGLILNKDQIAILEKNNINFYYWNGEFINSMTEIDFDSNIDYMKAEKILNI
jgi:hypothetical protein